jgi:hypothetical protein
MLKCGVCRQDRIVRFNNRVSHGGCRVHAELQLRLLAIVSGKTLKNESTKARSSSTAERVEDEETLQTSAVVSQSADLVCHNVNLFLSNCVMTTSICSVTSIVIQN